MLRPDTPFVPLGTANMTAGWSRIAPATLPAVPNAFRQLYRDVHSEVADFIEHGSSSAEVPALSTEGWMHQSRLQAGAQVSEPGLADGPAQQAFLNTIAPWAEESATRLGVAPHLVAAHAALESGWGQKPLRQADGRDTHNLFSIKAGGAWSGGSATSLTTEFEQGQPVKQQARFRSYPDYASAFRDYTRLLQDSPRYRGALNVGDDAQAFALGLARGGYATDPAYADKLARIASAVKASASKAPGLAAAAHSRD